MDKNNDVKEAVNAETTNYRQVIASVTYLKGGECCAVNCH